MKIYIHSFVVFRFIVLMALMNLVHMSALAFMDSNQDGVHIYYEITRVQVGDYKLNYCEVAPSPSNDKYKGYVKIPSIATYLHPYLGPYDYHVEGIGSRAFSDCVQLTGVTLPYSAEYVSYDAFDGCGNLSQIAINQPNSNFKVYEDVLYSYDGTSIVRYPAGRYDKEYVIRDNTTRIEGHAFEGCTILRKITIPSSVQVLCQEPFLNCKNLSELYCYIEVPPYSKYTDPLKGIDLDNCTLYVPAKSLKAYKKDSTWGKFKNIVGIGFVSVSELNIEPREVVLAIGETQKLNVTIKPNDATDQTIIWKSDNSKIASVSENGTIKAISEGKTVIIGKADDGSGVADTISVEVYAQPVTDIALSMDQLSLIIGGKKQLSAEIMPSNATNKDIKWSSDNPAVATVSETGLVTAIKEGTATITCTAQDGSGVSASCAVTVDFIPVSSISLNKELIYVKIGKGYQLMARISPSNANYQDLIWQSTNPDVATVDDKGWIKAISVGGATIECMATDGSGCKASCLVIVNPIYVSKITLNTTSASIYVGETLALSATVTPNNATNTNVKWSSSNDKVASVDDKGLVTAKSVRSVTITCTAEDGSGVSASCELTVKAIPISSITLNSTAEVMAVGGTFKLIPTIEPANATNNSLVWTTSDKSVITVDDDGLVTAHSRGRAKITCKAKSGDAYATCDISVYDIIQDGIFYNINTNKNTATVEGYDGKNAALEIPSSVKNTAGTYDVDSIADKAFYENQTIFSVELPSSVVSLGEETFGRCSNLTKFSAPNVTKLDCWWTFYYCTSLTEVNLPNLTHIGGQSTFEECTSLAKVDLPNLASIDNWSTFRSCTSLKEVNLPNLTYIGADCNFINCMSLEEINFPNLASIDGWDNFRNCTSLSKIDLPNLASIDGWDNFRNCTSLTKIDLPNLASIDGWDNFRNCTSLTKINFPNLASIDGWYNFYNCTSLKEVNLPNLTHIGGQYTFEDCTSLTDVDMPNVTTINGRTFRGCSNLVYANIPNISEIGPSAFIGCTALSRILLSSTLTQIGDKAFDSCTALNCITIECVNPFDITLGEGIFSDVPVDKCNLFVPKGSENLYKVAPVWRDFGNIWVTGEDILPTDYYLVGSFSDWACMEKYNFKANNINNIYSISDVTVSGEFMVTNSDFANVYMLASDEKFACNADLRLVAKGGVPSIIEGEVAATRITLDMDNLILHVETADGIRDIEIDGTSQYVIHGKTIEVTAGQTASIYTVDGRLVARDVREFTLQKGLYLINIGHRTSKVYIK